MSDPSPVPTWEEPVPYVNSLIQMAVANEMEAIHFQPTATGLDLRQRRHGVFGRAQHLPLEALRPLIDRIKTMSALDLNERRLPQDGRIRLTMDGRCIDVRVAVLPLLHGEKVVLHLLLDDKVPTSLAGLGMDGLQEEVVTSVLEARTGLVLVIGPTSSGTTTTLVTMARLLAERSAEVVVIGDATLVRHAPFSQMFQRPSCGLDTAACMRTALRADADAIVVDDLTCFETGELVLRTAQRGKLVLASLAARNALDAVQRLVDLGLSGHQLASALRLIVVQRLAPRACPACRVEGPRASARLQEMLAHQGVTGRLGAAPLVRAPGCTECCETGAAGRVPFFEVLSVGSQLAPALREAPSMGSLRQALGEERRRRLSDAIVEAALAGEISDEWLERHLASGLAPD